MKRTLLIVGAAIILIWAVITITRAASASSTVGDGGGYTQVQNGQTVYVPVYEPVPWYWYSNPTYWWGSPPVYNRVSRTYVTVNQLPQRTYVAPQRTSSGSVTYRPVTTINQTIINNQRSTTITRSGVPAGVSPATRPLNSQGNTGQTQRLVLPTDKKPLDQLHPDGTTSRQLKQGGTKIYSPAAPSKLGNSTTTKTYTTHK